MQVISIETDCNYGNDLNSTMGYIQDVEKTERWLGNFIKKNREAVRLPY